MLRLKTILIASFVAVPFIINAADWSMNMETKNAITVDMEKTVDDAEGSEDPDWETKYSYVRGNSNNFAFGKVQFNIKGDGFSGRAQVKVYTGKAKAGDVYMQYDVNDNLKFKIGYAGSPFGIKNVDNYKGQSTKAGKYGTSGPELNLSLIFSGVTVTLGANDGVVGSFDSTTTVVGDPKVYIPKLALAYDKSTDMIRFGVSTVLNVAQQEYVEANSTDTASISFMGWGAGTHFRLHVSKFWVQVSALFALNGEIAGINPNYNDDLNVVVKDGTAKGYTMFGAPVSVQYDITDNLSWNAGFGMFVETPGDADDSNEYKGWEMCTGFQIKNLLPGWKIWPDFQFGQKSMKVGDVTTTDKKMSIGVGTQLWF